MERKNCQGQALKRKQKKTGVNSFKNKTKKNKSKTE